MGRVPQHYRAPHTCVERWQEAVDPPRSLYTTHGSRFIHTSTYEVLRRGAAPAAELKTEEHPEEGLRAEHHGEDLLRAGHRVLQGNVERTSERERER